MSINNAHAMIIASRILEIITGKCISALPLPFPETIMVYSNMPGKGGSILQEAVV